jgi:tetratricopeptide (TPR) repeat protein
LDHHQEALDIRQSIWGDDHVDTADSHHHLGAVYQANGDYETALRRFRKALRIRKRVLGTDHIATAESYAAMGSVLQQPGNQQDLAGALVTHQKALRIQQLQPNINRADLANTFDNMGLVLHALGDYRGALQLHQKALEGYEAVLGHDSEEVAVTLNHIGGTYHAMGDFKQALQTYQQALQVAEIVVGTDHADTAITYSNIGAVLRAQGDCVGALEQHKKALSIKEKVLGPNHADTAISYGQIGMALKDQGHFQESSEFYQKALEIEEVALGNDHSTTAAVAHHQLGSDLAQMGDTRGAWGEYRKSLHILLHQLHERQQSCSTTGAVETKNTNRILSHVVSEMLDLANAAAGRPPRLEQVSSDEESTVSSPIKAVPAANLAEFFCGMSYHST